jgi:hypothetical protein
MRYPFSAQIQCDFNYLFSCFTNLPVMGFLLEGYAVVGLSVKGTLVELAIRVLVGMLVGLPVVGLSVKAMLV